MEKRRKVTNPLALAVLAELLVESMHPYEMGRRLKDNGKDRSFKYNRGSLYMVVEQLRKAGFIIEQETVRDTQRPERTVYALTDEGRHEFYDWMRELVAQPRHEYPQFGVALSLLSVLSPADSVELLTQRSAALSEEADEIRTVVQSALDDGVRWVFLVEDEYRLTVLEAERRFVTGLIESLKQPDYIRAWQEIFGSQT
ncbi:PadR family transcriptional regulator [Streptosporangium roseum]|uniref:PadR-like family transcriptional regulator n=1 Tax=Streptosporangium roseum (strain ATCC 12428 / DSM 43021 / JCM 3005 / KCTC 9067 / NCIMB 10171 / NRRL 2505 / NI 9100) TaxID=479432 RepID=D2ASN5_STRRD|nr:PadR family transcriptional regulator [Streptosporangium roseum]ACZ88558.1 PadR-like family transcriptional regulator [Streptosporangium roseum DSM 43021]